MQPPRLPPRDGQLGFLHLPPVRVQGISVGGEQAVVHIPEFDLAFDIGLCPRVALTASCVALSHAHMDHVAGLPYWFSQRYFQKLGSGKVICHVQIAPAIAAMMRSWVDLERQRTPHEILPVEPEQDTPLKNNLRLRAIAVSHTVPALGYALIEKRSKLKEEFVGMSQEQLRRLRMDGVEISRAFDVPLVAYTGDTEPGEFLLRPEFAQARVVITECTFFDPAHRERARTGKHIHVDDLPEYLRCWQAEHVVVVHVSRRTAMQYARQRLDELDGGAHSARLHMLMDHRTNRARLAMASGASQEPAVDNSEVRPADGVSPLVTEESD